MDQNIEQAFAQPVRGRANGVGLRACRARPFNRPPTMRMGYFPRGLLDPEGLPPKDLPPEGLPPPEDARQKGARRMACGPRAGRQRISQRGARRMACRQRSARQSFCRGRADARHPLLGRSPKSLRGPRGRSPLLAPSLAKLGRSPRCGRASPVSLRAPRKVLAAPVAPADLSERGPLLRSAAKGFSRASVFSRSSLKRRALRVSDGGASARRAVLTRSTATFRPLRSSVASRSVRRRGPFSALTRSPRKAETCLRGSGFSCEAKDFLTVFSPRSVRSTGFFPRGPLTNSGSGSGVRSNTGPSKSTLASWAGLAPSWSARMRVFTSSTAPSAVSPSWNGP